MDKEDFLKQNSLHFFCGVELTNLEWLFLEKVVIQKCQEQGNIVPSKEDMLHMILKMAMSK